MLKKRLIFTLLYENGEYALSRNFRLQSVGDLAWLRENYSFDAIAFSIDELIVLNVERGKSDLKKFAASLAELSRNYFLPIAAGGGIRSVEDAYLLLNSNADKVVVNTSIMEDPKLVSELAGIFGKQCVVASIDCRKAGDDYDVYIKSGTQNTGLKVKDAVKTAGELGAGEIYLTSIDRDGTGFGYDCALIERAASVTKLPFIASGGVGKYSHFVEGLKYVHVNAASTANIYNFVVDGLKNARRYIEDSGIKMAKWNYDLEGLHDACVAH